MNAKRKTANAKRKTAWNGGSFTPKQRKTAWNGGSFYPKATIRDSERWSFNPKATVRDSLAVAPNRRQDRTRLHSVSALSTTARRAERCLFRI